jgi:membrane protease YdiL (CAAX protease family)
MRPDRPLLIAVGALVVAVAAVLTVDRFGYLASAHLQIVLGFAATWVPFIAAVLVAVGISRRAGVGVPRAGVARESGDGIRSLTGWRFAPVDLLWGAGIGIVARCVATLVELVAFGRVAGGGALFGDIDGWYVFAAVIAPILIAPLIEETFFRGLLQGSLTAWLRTRGVTGAAVVSVVAVAIVFTAVHLIGVGTVTGIVTTGTPLLAFALGVGALRTATGRIGGAVVAHVVFNALGVWLAWPL